MEVAEEKHCNAMLSLPWHAPPPHQDVILHRRDKQHCSPRRRTSALPERLLEARAKIQWDSRIEHAFAPKPLGSRRALRTSVMKTING